MQIDVRAACKLLEEHDDILILTHQKPDGDTLGGGFALLWALERLGKRGRVECSDGYPERYRFIFGDYAPEAFAPRFVTAVDVADASLLGGLEPIWSERIDLCIDHHPSNSLNAAYKLVNPDAPAAALLAYEIINGLGAGWDKRMATAVFTGISTDTGCFKYGNVTAEAHRVAAEMIEAGADHGLVNKLMFDTKSRGRIEADKIIYDTLEYFLEGRCAMITIMADVTERYGVSAIDLDGISSYPRRVEGVLAGVTLRENRDGSFRVSLRTGDGLDASRICMKLGGGGHKNAAGCVIAGTADQVKGIILCEIERALKPLKP